MLHHLTGKDVAAGLAKQNWFDCSRTQDWVQEAQHASNFVPSLCVGF
jgi:hypothetical protein